jgi:hypothetical protein
MTDLDLDCLDFILGGVLPTCTFDDLGALVCTGDTRPY